MRAAIIIYSLGNAGINKNTLSPHCSRHPHRHCPPHRKVKETSLSIFAQTGGSTYRAMVYAQTEERIKMLNELYGEYYTSAHNQFSHLTPEEFAATYLGGSMSEEGSVSRMHVAAPTKEQR